MVLYRNRIDDLLAGGAAAATAKVLRSFMVGPVSVVVKVEWAKLLCGQRRDVAMRRAGSGASQLALEARPRMTAAMSTGVAEYARP